MPNKRYLKGVRKERELVNNARIDGKIAFRSSGSHSPIDVCIINPIDKTIEMIQSKNYKGKLSKKERIDKEKFETQTGNYMVKFRYLSKNG